MQRRFGSYTCPILGRVLALAQKTVKIRLTNGKIRIVPCTLHFSTLMSEGNPWHYSEQHRTTRRNVSSERPATI